MAQSPPPSPSPTSHTHLLTVDSHQNPLPQPVAVVVRECADCIVLVLHNAHGEETASVHLEVDAARGGRLTLRAWDSRNADQGTYGEPFLEEDLITEAPA
ncbi:hypothetical protein [Deinococcus aluminii]|uniref:Uncharacterized protein n=1 Tax=Deinococcus aluminii TaxID=1656885 RepID=A0ABP9XGZ9_9DEIO